MALSTYAELQTSIGAFLNRDDMASIAPDLIRLAEASLQRDVRHWRMEKQATLTADGRYEDLPEDFLEIIRVSVDGTEEPLRPISVWDMQHRRARRDDVSGKPLEYAIEAGQFEFHPTPDDDYTINLYYIRTLPSLSDSNTTNWLLDLAPDAYLYGALAHSAPYLQEDERVATWGGLYEQAVRALNGQSMAAKHGAGARRRIRTA